jgi:Cu(I)/Ag(I) efflux system membrane fusion protein
MKTIKIKKINYGTLILVLIMSLAVGWIVFHKPATVAEADHDHSEHAVEDSIWTCSMHPQIREDEFGLCPICGMDLIPLVASAGNSDQSNSNAIEMSDAALKLAEVQTVVVRKGEAGKELYLTGKVEPDERNISELTARFGGRIENLYVNFTGQTVAKGAKLATIYSPDLVSAQKELLVSAGLRESNPALYEAARNKLKLWNLTDSQIDGVLASGEPKYNFDILAPIAGTVTTRNVSIGDYVKEGDPLFEVINLKKVWLLFDAYESDLPWLGLGDDVEFTVKSLPGETFTGKISFIDPLINEMTRVANVRVEVDNSNNELKPGMFANGIIRSVLTAGQEDLLIPKSAVLWTGKRSIVYVGMNETDKNIFMYREVTLGPEAGDYYVVKSGLMEGETIVVNGAFKVDAAAQLEGKRSMMHPEI